MPSEEESDKVCFTKLRAPDDHALTHFISNLYTLFGPTTRVGSFILYLFSRQSPTPYDSAILKPNASLDTIRDSVGLDFQSVVQNVRTLKQNEPILQQYPDIRRNWEASISYRDSLTHESFTSVPIQWDHVADSVYDDLPVMKSRIIVALRASGIANP